MSRAFHTVASGSGSVSSGGRDNYDELVELVRRGFHWDNLIRFCSLLSENEGEQGFYEAFQAIRWGLHSSDSQVCLSSLMYADNITENFKSTPTVLTLLKHFASPSFCNALVQALQQHVSDQAIMKQASKCLVEWAQIAGSQNRIDQEWIAVSNKFLQMLNQAQEYGAENWLKTSSNGDLVSPSSHPIASGQQLISLDEGANVSRPDDEEYEQQLAKALELSTKENYRQTTYHDDDQTIRAVMELSKLEMEMQGAQKTKTKLKTVSKERDEGLRAIDELNQDLAGVLKQLEESQKQLEKKSKKLSSEMSKLDIVNGPNNAWEKIADLSKAHSEVDNDLRRVKHQKELIQYAASELKSIDEFIVNEDLGKEQAQQIHESIVGELMEKIVVTGGKVDGGQIPVTVVQELKQRFGDDDEQEEKEEGEKSIGRKISSSIRKFLVRGNKGKGKEPNKVKVPAPPKENKAKTSAPPRGVGKLKERQQQQQRQQQQLVAPESSSPAPPKEESRSAQAASKKKSKSEMMSVLNDIKQAGKDAAATGKKAVPVVKKGGAPPPPPPPPGKAGGFAPPPPPPPGRGGGPPPPPPPPGGMGRQRSASDVKRAPQVVALYQELRKALIGPTTSNQTNTRRGSVGQGNSGGGDSAQMFAEMAGKSTYLSQIKADVLMHGDFINEVISSINSLKATDMDGLSSFVFKVDHALESILTDERAVLKHFPKWPEAKFDTMREASGMHMELVAVKDMNWQCGGEPVEVECSKIGAYFEKCAKTIDGHQISLEKSKAKFKEHGIPWDGQMIEKAKLGTLVLAKLYMSNILSEVEHLEQKNQKSSAARINSLLVSAVRFAFKVHQFVRGFNNDCIGLFEKISIKMKDYNL